MKGFPNFCMLVLMLFAVSQPNYATAPPNEDGQTVMLFQYQYEPAPVSIAQSLASQIRFAPDQSELILELPDYIQRRQRFHGRTIGTTFYDQPLFA